MVIKLLNVYLYTVKYVNIDCAFVIFPVFLCIFHISFPLLFGCFYGHLHVNSKKLLFLASSSVPVAYSYYKDLGDNSIGCCGNEPDVTNRELQFTKALRNRMKGEWANWRAM